MSDQLGGIKKSSARFFGIIASALSIMSFNKHSNQVNKDKPNYKPRDTNLEKILNKKLKAPMGIGNNQRKKRKLLRSNLHLRRNKRFK